MIPGSIPYLPSLPFLHCQIFLPFLHQLTRLLSLLHLLTPRQVLQGLQKQRGPLILPSMKRGKGICLLEHSLTEGWLLLYEMSCFLVGMILRNGDEIGGCLLGLRGAIA